MQEQVERVRERFAAVDAEVDRFIQASGLACPTGCGGCCRSPEIEATSIELVPMAAALVAEGRGLEVLRALDAAPSFGPCVMYIPEAGDPSRGRCSAYAVRPLVCRLFGFGTRRERGGRVKLVSCRTMQAADPVRVSAVAGDPAMLALAPVMSEHVHALGTDFPGAGAYARPINGALRAALERELLRDQLGRLADTLLGAVTDDGRAPEPPLAAA